MCIYQKPKYMTRPDIIKMPEKLPWEIIWLLIKIFVVLWEVFLLLSSPSNNILKCKTKTNWPFNNSFWHFPMYYMLSTQETSLFFLVKDVLSMCLFLTFVVRLCYHSCRFSSKWIAVVLGKEGKILKMWVHLKIYSMIIF